ncbi:MAG: type III pantothenate kinase [Elusimicrobia bacterium]|nr:type III pantothenate kinase [Elusimicrobiota bacterium]
MRLHPHLLIAIDIGNTSITAGLFKGSKLVSKRNIPTQPHGSEKKYYAQLRRLLSAGSYGSGKKPEISDVVISSVVPSLNKKFISISKRYFKKAPLFIDNKNCGIRIRYKRPSEVGADRLVNAVAGWELFGRGDKARALPMIIIDSGTAVTFDCLNSKGEYLGGVIFPGKRIASLALNKYTAKLPLVRITESKKSYPPVIGRTTAGSIAAGLHFGYTGMIKEILGALKKKLKNAIVVVTGGYAKSVISGIPDVKNVAPDLTLRGLWIIRERNKKGGKHK